MTVKEQSRRKVVPRPRPNLKTALLELSRGLLMAPDERAAAECAVEAATAALRADFCSLVLPDAAGRLLVRAVHGWPRDVVGQFELDRGNASQAGYTILQGHPVAVEDYAREKKFSVPPGIFAQGIVSGLSVPMIFEERVVGALIVHSRTLRRFSEDEIGWLSLIANQAAVALERARLFAQTRAEAEETLKLYTASRAIVQAQTYDDVLAAVLEYVTALCPDRVSISLADREPGSDWLEVRAVWQPSGQPIVGLGARYRWLDSVMMPLVGAQGELAAIITDVAADDRLPLPAREFMAQRGMRATVVLPMGWPPNLIGTIGVFWARPRGCSPRELNNLRTLADLAGSNIEKLRLLEETRQRNAELSLLYEASRDAVNSLQLNEVPRRVAQHIVAALGATSAYVFTLDENTNLATVVAQYISPEAGPNESIVEADKTYDLSRSPKTYAVMKAGQPFILSAADPTADLMSRKWLIEHGCKTSLRIPLLLAGNRLLGYINIWESRVEREWTPGEIRLARTLADLLAVAVDNARLFEEVQRLAATDSLTGVYNRRRFFELADREFERAQRYVRPLSAIMFDIDHFKRVNDVHGHAVGDQVLRTMAQRCRENLREIDLLGRYGGDEFSVLLPESDLNRAHNAAERLRRCTADVPIGTERGPLTATISLGIASADGCQDLLALLNRADVALYWAKKAGRNRVEGWQDGAALR